MGKIKLGTVVRDSFGQEGIVCTEEPTPPDDWINEQVDSERVKKLGPTNWWGVLHFGGGYLLEPEALLQPLRQASYEDFLNAVDGAGVPGRARLAKIFPHYVDRVLAERRAREDS